MKFANLKVGHRLFMLLGAVVACFAVYGAVSFATLNRLKVNGPLYQQIVEDKDLTADILPPPAYIVESYLVALQLAGAAKDEQPALVARLRKLKTEYDERHDHWTKAGLPEELQSSFLRAAHDPALAFYKAAFERFVPALEAGDRSAATAALGVMAGHYEQHRTAINAVVEITNRHIAENEAAAVVAIGRAQWLMLGSGAVATALMLAAGLLLARSIVLPLRRAVTAAERVAEGDLTQSIRADTTDEAGQLLAAMGRMNERLREVIDEIRAVSQSVAVASGQIASGNMDLSRRTETQASSLAEAASSMGELTHAVKTNADSAQRANELAAGASGVASKGGAAMEQVVSTMQAISASSHQIADIIGVIDGIAFQTNILALNAAVEAARAGEQGRGFAVVASEVRGLAQKSAQAAKEIKGLITDSVAKVDDGTALVEDAGRTMREIVDSVGKVTAIMAEISVASAEARTGIEHMNQAIAHMDESTQNNSELVEESAAAAQSMDDQAKHLAHVLSRFRVGAQDASARVAG